MSLNLQDYIDRTQRLLHDPNADFWPISDLISYINQARDQVTLDTQALRRIVTYALTAGISSYDAAVVFATVDQVRSVLAIVDIYAIWSTERYKLKNRAYTTLNNELRPWTNYQTYVIGWARMGQTGVVVGPIPDQAYSTEWDLIYAPLDLVLVTDAEADLVYPQTNPVPYYAAYLARMYEEDDKKAQQALNLYRAKISESQANFVTLGGEEASDTEGF